MYTPNNEKGWKENFFQKSPTQLLIMVHKSLSRHAKRQHKYNTYDNKGHELLDLT